MPWRRTLIAGTCVLLAGGVAFAWVNGDEGDQEMTVKEADVPPAALKALKELAKSSKIVEFAKEIEHGHTYYEGSWKSDHGRIDALVTAEGNIVEIEEGIHSASLPKSIMEAVQKDAGKGNKFRAERKTIYLYEVHFRQNGKWHEAVYSPDGRRHGHEEAGESENEGHEDDD